MMRLDAAWRVYSGVNDDLTVNYNAGGNTTVTLTAGLYMSLSALCAEVQTQLQTVHASLTCSESSGLVTVAGTANFVVTWDTVGLRDFLGFTGTLTGANTYTGTLSPGVYEASLPWSDDEPGWRYSVKGLDGERQTGRVQKLGRVRFWSVAAWVPGDELADFRTALSYFLRGGAGTWYRNTADATAWSYTNWDGKLEVVPDERLRQYADEWQDQSGVQSLARVPLTFTEYS